MVLPVGQISLSQVNTELEVAPSSTQINMGSAPVRSLAEVPTGAIAMSNLQGKSYAQYVTATGGTVTTSGDYKIHTFNSAGSFVVSSVGNPLGSQTVDYVVQGGGAGAGVRGGGGAGGNLSNYPNPAFAGHPVSVTTYPISVGGGGSYGGGHNQRGNAGGNSTFDTITANGGGGGAGIGLGEGIPGACGGGTQGCSPGRGTASGNDPAKSAPATPVQGFPGGPAGLQTSQGGGSGGGGTSQAGGGIVKPIADGAGGGNGGGGRATTITGSSVTLGGGGGGEGSVNGNGGAGGGGSKGGNPGTANTGGGGGAGPSGASGGSGVVVIRYKFQ